MHLLAETNEVKKWQVKFFTPSIKRMFRVFLITRIANEYFTSQ